jgi:hypothetical protein
MEPTPDQKQRYALRQCYLLAIRMARKAQKADDSRSSEWNHIIRFCKDADEDGNICGSSVLRQSEPETTRTRCPARSPGGVAPDGTLPQKGTQCGLDAGHDGDHTVLMESGAPWWPSA